MPNTKLTRSKKYPGSGELYKLTFANGKAYIGVSSSAKRRFRAHLNAAEKGAKQIVYRAWRKHGQPELTVLAIVEDYDLPALEINAIQAFNTLIPNGYNTSFGGEISPMKFEWVAAKLIGNKHLLGHKHSEKTRNKFSERRASEETKAKMRAARAGHKPYLGRKHSEETKKKQAMAMLGNKHLLGFRPTEESRAKMRKAQSRRKRGNDGRFA